MYIDYVNLCTFFFILHNFYTDAYGGTGGYPKNLEWREQDETDHVHTCSDCQATATEAHDWGVWQDDEDGEHHTRSCETCPAEQTRSHAWAEWYETDGETWTRDCDDCAAREVKADPRHVAAALLQDGKYRPYYTLQSAFDDAVSGQTVCIVFYEEGVALDETLVIGKSVLLGAVTRTVGEDRRASYAETSRALTFKRADGFTGTMISIARGADIRFDNLILQGGEESAPSVEVYGSLTVAGGSIDAACSIRVRSGGAQGISLLALGDAVLSLVGDDGTVEVEGESRTFDFSRPVGTAFVYRYLTEDGVLFAAVDHTNYERIQAGAIVYETMTERQQGVVDERLAATFGSFAELLAAVSDYLAAQSRKVEDFLHENDAVIKEFGSITSEDSAALEEALAGIDPEDVESGARIEELLSGGMEQLDAVCADYVVSGGGTPAEALSDDRAGRTSELHGYLKRENGFRGESKLSLLLFRAESPTRSDLVVLFGLKVELTGAEQIGNVQVALLLPAEARGYMGYRVIAKDGNGEMLSASTEGNVLLFDTDGGAELLVLAQKQVDLVWLVVLLSCLCGLETAALCYVVWHLIGSRTASFAPLLAVAVIPASAVTVCAVLGAVCVGEGIALILLLRTILRREKKRAVS